jgi:cell division protein FtsB
MRVRRRIGHYVHLLLLSAICCAISGYFGYSFLFDEGGLIAWRSTQDQLSLAKHDLAQLRNRREALQHRISLLDDNIDPDLLDEVAHNLLVESHRDEVVIPREKH